MAVIKPIYATRYTSKSGELSDNVCPPYDIISPAGREELVARSPHNLVRLELPEGGDDRYRNAGKLLQEWLDAGILARDNDEGMFVYSEKFSIGGRDYVFTGLICLVKLSPFSEKVVLPHEETLSKAKTDRFNLMRETFCNFSPVYSLYNDDQNAIGGILANLENSTPEAEFTDDENVTHILRKISDPAILAQLEASFADKQLFIADGHHRYETALNFHNALRDENHPAAEGAGYVMMTLVDMADSGLVVLPTHRLVRDLDYDRNEMLATLRNDFVITEYPDADKIEQILAEKGKGALALYEGGKGFTLLEPWAHARQLEIEGHSAAYGGLDVAILHTLVLEKALGIDKENMAAQKNLIYTRSSAEAIERVKSGECNMSFLLNATQISEIREVSLAGDKMPQKSTYFYPKLKTGLVINHFA